MWAPICFIEGNTSRGPSTPAPDPEPRVSKRSKVAAGKLPRDREIILYCGCCPWGNCPNVKPAVELLKQMGFTHVKAMFVESNFAKDWIDKGYPVELGSAKQ